MTEACRTVGFCLITTLKVDVRGSREDIRLNMSHAARVWSRLDCCFPFWSEVSAEFPLC